MKVIAISGWKRSGKDASAEHLIENHGFTRVSFADTLKDMCAEQYPVPRSHFDDPAFKEKPILHLPVSPKDDFSNHICTYMFKEFRDASGNIPMACHNDTSGTFMGVMQYRSLAQLYWTPRAIAILEGTGAKRAVSSSYWIDRAIDKISKLELDKIVISDVRFKSEADALKEAFGSDVSLVRINRFDTCDTDSPTERDLDDYNFDTVIENHGTLEDLFENIDKVTKE